MIADEQARDLIDKLKVNPFIDGPADALVKATAELIGSVREFKYVFRDNVDTYERFDYSERSLPALRVYNRTYRKEHESHYVNGEVCIDVVYPNDIRREELQRFQDVMTSALLQELRSPTFFGAALARVPGLNELGKVFDVDKTLGLALDDGWVPLSQTKANFRIDLKQWDAYLEEQGRTKEDPFNVTLRELRLIAAQILPKLEDGTPDYPAAVNVDTTQGGDQ